MQDSVDVHLFGQLALTRDDALGDLVLTEIWPRCPSG